MVLNVCIGVQVVKLPCFDLELQDLKTVCLSIFHYI